MSDQDTTSRLWVTHPPEPRAAVCAKDAPVVKGERVVLVTWKGEYRGHYAVSNVYTINGRAFVDVLSESELWYQRLLDRHTEPGRWPAAMVWLE